MPHLLSQPDAAGRPDAHPVAAAPSQRGFHPVAEAVQHIQRHECLRCAAKAAAEKGIHVNIVGMGDPKGSPIPIQGSNNYMKDKDGNVVITKLNEQMGQEIAAAGNGMYVRADNTNSALKALQKEIEKMNKTELDSKVYSEYDEQFQIFAWIALFLLIADFMTLDRKNRIFRKVKLFS